MTRSLSFAAAMCFVTVLNSNLSWAQDSARVTLSDQRIEVPFKGPTLSGTIWAAGYYGITFAAIPDASIPIDPSLQPSSLIARLGTTLKVEGGGWPTDDKPLTPDQVLAALPTTAFRITGLFAKDGGSARFYDSTGPVAGPILYVTGYETTPSRPPPALDDILHGRYGDREHVRVNAYIVRISGIEPCEALNVCRDGK